MDKRKYDSTVASIAGNLLSGSRRSDGGESLTYQDEANAIWAVKMARAIVAQVQRPELPEMAECICNGGEQGEGLVSIPHESYCPLVNS